MRFPIVILSVASFALAACGGSVRDSNLNPVNWFGSSTSTNVETVERPQSELVGEENPLIKNNRRASARQGANNKAPTGSFFDSIFNKDEGPYEGTLVDQVTELDIKRTSTGAIVAVSGVTTRQGAFDVRLIPANNGRPLDGVLTYEFRALQPIETAQGPERTRRVQAAQRLSVQDLEDIRTVRVIARRNTRTSRR